MATPTPGKPSVAATPPVSTPFSQSHLTAFSPRAPPRGSVGPSPQQIRKSPANSNTLYGHPTSSSFAMNFDSPSAAAPGLGDMALDFPLAMGRGEDDQKSKVAQILDVLKVSKGRVTEDGLERLARRLGISYMWERDLRAHTKTIVFAGKANLLSLEVTFLNNTVHRVSLDLLGDSSEGVTEYKEKGGQILMKDLEYGPGESALTKMLDDFADNLERLAVLDRLTITPMLNCYEAIAGIHKSLKRIYEWEVANLEQVGSQRDDDWLSRCVMCTKSGRPVMHSRKRVGLSMEYWQEKRLVSRASAKESGTPKIWAMVLECTNAPDVSFTNPPEEPYTRVRVSDTWISQSIIKSNPSAEDMMSTAAPDTFLDWLEPDLTLVPATDASKADADMIGMALNDAGQSKLPDVMFIAKFEPPLAIPNYIADYIYQEIGATASLFPAIRTIAIDALLLPLTLEEFNALSPSRQVRRQRTVPIMNQNGGRTSRLHKNTLFIQKQDPGYELCELPFSHPRQLVKILPCLRQYAFLATLIENSFGAKTEKIPANVSRREEKKTTNKRDDFMAFMQERNDDPKDIKTLNLDVTLITESGGMMQPPFPGPRIELVFPFRNRSANLAFAIGWNGTVDVLHENILPRDEDEMEGLNGGAKKKSLTKEDLGRILETCEDLGVFAEYVRRRLG